MIQYECDICGTLNPPADTYGPGVIVAMPDMDTLGRGDPMVWYKEMDGVTSAYLSVMPSTDKPSSHVCGGCVRSLLLEMIEEKWPETTPSLTMPIETDTYDMYAHLEHGIKHPNTAEARAFCKYLHPGYDDVTLVSEERQYPETWEEEPTDVKDVPDGDGADPDVREVRAEPEVQGTSADGDAGDEPHATYQDLGNCPSCTQPWEHHAGPLCVVPNRHRVVRSSRRGTGEG